MNDDSSSIVLFDISTESQLWCGIERRGDGVNASFSIEKDGDIEFCLSAADLKRLCDLMLSALAATNE
jgi:hypothetical protein